MILSPKSAAKSISRNIWTPVSVQSYPFVVLSLLMRNLAVLSMHDIEEALEKVAT